ncbi:MAG: PHP domain-containing protein [Anaerolineaceae bacterium]|nr:PHP domain-containing protein [Anaerolineaceae bacterium]
MTIDLHTHTNYSDGFFSPAEVIQAAAEKGLRAIAISDHDTTRGAREALPLAAAAGIELVPAIEITTSWLGVGLSKGEQDVDLLGFFIDLEDAEFRAYETALLADIHQRVADCCTRLSQQGYPIMIEDVFAENPHYAGPLYTVLALMHKDLASDWDAGSRLFNPVWAERRPSSFTIQSAIAAIHRAGGAAVLAHPSIVNPNGRTLDAGSLRLLVDAGLDGIEIFHHRLDAAAREHFMALAERFHLVTTGGSDLHGYHEGTARLGQEPVSPEMLEAVRESAKEIRSKTG